jgi:hypothetical protein
LLPWHWLPLLSHHHHTLVFTRESMPSKKILLYISVFSLLTIFRDMVKKSGLVANTLISVLPAVSNPHVVLGADSSFPYQNTIINNSTESLFLAFWEGEQFNLPLTPYNPNPVAPLLTVVIPQGENKTVSLASTFNGAYAAVFSDTKIGMGGNIAEPYIEFTGGEFGTFDLSRLPNMEGHSVSIASDTCTSDNERCVYTCKAVGGVVPNNCYEAGSYDLSNCNQKGSNPGLDSWGQPSGGCQVGAQANFVTTFNDIVASA